MWYGSAPAARVVGDRQHRLDDVRVGVVGLGREDDDRPRRLEPGDLEVVDVHRRAGAADDRGPAGVRQARPDVVVHLDLVAVGQDDDGALRLVRVGRHQLGDDREDLLRPAEDDGVSALDDARAALAQLGELALEPGVDDADERADDEDADQGDGEHPDAGSRTTPRRRPSCPGRASASGCSRAGPRGDASVRKRTATTIVTMTTPMAAMTKRPRMRAMVPRAMKLSKA